MKIRNKFFLAPIDEYTNLPFRMLCTEYGADYTVIPLVSATAIFRSEDALAQIHTVPEEKNVGVQLFGNEPEELKVAIERIRNAHENILWFDLNLGCPSPKVIGSKCGAYLLDYPKRIAGLMKAMADTGETVSAKMRIGPRSVEIAKIIDKEGADFIAVHGRTRAQGYMGKADWEKIREIKDAVSIPVIGNGDISSREEGFMKIKEGYCDSVMVGRNAMSDPMLFSRKAEEKNEKLAKKMLTDYVELCEKYGRLDATDLRVKAMHITKGLRESKKIRESLSRRMELKEVKEVISNL